MKMKFSDFPMEHMDNPKEKRIRFRRRIVPEFS